jgi:amino acid transporter
VPLYLSVLLWATCGFEYSGFLAGDVDKPRRTFPIVMIGTYLSPPASVRACRGDTDGGSRLVHPGSIFLMIATYFFPIAMAIAIAEDPSEITEGAYPALALEIGLGTRSTQVATHTGASAHMHCRHARIVYGAR